MLFLHHFIKGITYKICKAYPMLTSMFVRELLEETSWSFIKTILQYMLLKINTERINVNDSAVCYEIYSMRLLQLYLLRYQCSWL